MKKHPLTGEKSTQKELAKYIGVRQQTVAQYIYGETMPTAKNCLAIADYFGVSVDYLLIGFEDSELQTSMVDAQRRRIYERLENIAVLCSNAENLALTLMESEVKPDCVCQRKSCAKVHEKVKHYQHKKNWGTGGSDVYIGEPKCTTFGALIQQCKKG